MGEPADPQHTPKIGENKRISKLSHHCISKWLISDPDILETVSIQRKPLDLANAVFAFANQTLRGRDPARNGRRLLVLQVGEKNA